jgi:8-oxo-dGTP pyrophosphatase MutT (NUDIX family)
MRATTSEDVAAVVEWLEPSDQLEAQHRTDALEWLASTDDIFRREVPRTPPKHLVAYFLLQNPVDGCVLLVHHRKAGLWLPTGGHVEVGEDPAETVRREALEELAVQAVFADPGARPLFVTVTETVGAADVRHTDVSLWYLLTRSRGDDLHPDEREFTAVRWWTRAEVAASDPRAVEPHLGRFLAKVDAAG